jgi:hypothetical protein
MQCDPETAAELERLLHSVRKGLSPAERRWLRMVLRPDRLQASQPVDTRLNGRPWW